ncbi:hypothetical protein [Phytoactinopolyspora limicola]|uniref:hypothetical protein n=1 Tax=Phytoactinopolyspora limicola TaxID=2715536 RepID=UPI00140971EA|nr:hypothetical protein [Phytoactinopolyspora limicola]
METPGADLVDAHPAAYYQHAARLFEDGHKDDAVFWFYAGQLRFRFHLMANPDLPRDEDPALFAALSQSVGAPLNLYAVGDVDALVAQIDAVLEWDTTTPNNFTSREDHRTEWENVRGGLTALRDTFLRDADAIRAERTRRGLENR